MLNHHTHDTAPAKPAGTHANHGNQKSRPKAPEIRTIPESAPWVLLSKAAAESGLTERLIRQAGLPTRKFGNALYIAPPTLNGWLLPAGTTGNK